ncbi:MAG: DMT family transporter [Candidatus Cloacimonas sp.]|jgi:drug/metabolite transporter (DMT)-like permease|nr:DMT family transporter [Candidatus Cloacimonas sp.]
MKIYLIYLKAALAMMCWSITFVWIKIAYETYLPYEVVLLRLLLASSLLFLVMWISGKAEKIKKKDFRNLLLVATCEPFLYFIGEANGMQYVSSTLGSLVISTIPIFTALGAWWLLREKVSVYLLLGLLVSTCGVAVMSLGSKDLSATTKGIMYLMLAVFGGVFYGITVRNLTLRYTALTIVAYQSLFGLILFIPLFIIFNARHFFTVKHSVEGLTTIAAMSMFASVGAFMLFTGVIRELGVIKSNVFTNLIPVFTVILAYFILGDTLNQAAVIGLSLAIFGLLLSQYPDLQRLRRRQLRQSK